MPPVKEATREHGRRASVRIVPAKARDPSKPEFRRQQDWLEVTLPAADIPDGKFRYVLRPKYLFVWSDQAGHAQHRFIVLPERVDPKEHVATFTNGVVDVRIRRAGRQG